MTIHKSMNKPYGWLASVRTPQEAENVLASSADIIDVKEPSHGALGCADQQSITAIAEVVGSRRFLTVAAGDYTQASMQDACAVLARIAAITAIDVIKIGLRLPQECDNKALSFTSWADVVERAGRKWALVLFVDDGAFLRQWRWVVRRAAMQGCYACIFDTADKENALSLPTMLSRADMEMHHSNDAWFGHAHSHCWWLDVAGFGIFR